MKNEIKSEDGNIRQRAEDLLKKKLANSSFQITEADKIKLIHELEVHQIELEMLNEEFLLAKEQAGTAAEKYSELYDFAPSGYFTFSSQSAIIELNLNAAKILGNERSYFKNHLFGFFLSDNSKPIDEKLLFSVIMRCLNKKNNTLLTQKILYNDR